MTGVSGADIDELRQLAKTVSQSADRIESVIGSVNNQISSAAWTGPDANRYRSQWQGDSSAKLRNVVSALRDASTALDRNATEQQNASAAGGGATAGSSGGGGHHTDSSKSAPTSTAGLYDRLRQVTASGDGLYIEKVKDPQTGQVRAMVYLGGTTSNQSNQPFSGNVSDIATEMPKPEQVAQINAALKNLPSNTPIMLVGYSQGGMDAQLLAQDSKALDGHVAAVVTYGSPVITGPPVVPTVHLRDVADIVPGAGNPADYAANQIAGATFVGTSSNDSAAISSVLHNPFDVVGAGLKVHETQSTYDQVSNEFDASSGYDKVKSAMDQFRGQVVN